MGTTGGSAAVRRGLAAVMCVLATIVLAACSSDADSDARPTATVRAVPSGDSVTLVVDGHETTVELAYIEAPVRRSADEAQSCLATESTAVLQGILPMDSTIAFEQAGSGVLLYDAGGQSVNAAALAAGLAVLMQEHEASADVPAALLSAFEQARFDQVGLHSTDERCTAASMLVDAGIGTDCLAGSTYAAVSASASPSAAPTSSSTATTTTTTSASAAPAASSAELRVDLGLADARWEELAGLSTWIHDHRNSVVWRALSTAQRATCQDLVNEELAVVLHEQSDLDRQLTDAEEREAEAARIAEEQRLAAEAEAARKAEEQRIAAETEAARVAEEQRIAAEAEAARIAEEQRIAAEAEAARIAAEAEVERAAQGQQSQSPSVSGGSDDSDDQQSDSGSGGGGDLSGYTGPRCYAPGGKTWRPC
jgi:micrococcal nuclease